MADKKFDESEGVWRTIGGRRVFIRTGQSLSDAMKESGKFKKTSDVKREEYHSTKDELALKEKINDEIKKGVASDEETYELTKKIEARYNQEESKDISNLEGKHIAGNEKQNRQELIDKGYRWQDDDGNIITPSEDFIKLAGGNYVKQNEDGSSVYISTGKDVNGNVSYMREDYDKNGEGRTQNVFSSLEEAKNGKDNVSQYYEEQERQALRSKDMTYAYSKKAYEKYLKEHPASKMSFEEFKKEK